MSQKSQDVGVLFSNATHHVVFLNGILQAMLDYPDNRKSTLIGKPVHTILGISEEVYQALAQQIEAENKVTEVPLDLHSQAGTRLKVLVEGIKNNIDGTFVGIDYTFHKTDEELSSVEKSKIDIPTEIAHEIVRFYFKRQLEGLHKVMVTWGGKKLGQRLNEVINNTATQHQWLVTMDGDKITDTPATLELDNYRGLLHSGAAYVSKVLGSAAMRKQVEKVNEQTNPKTFDYFDSDWYENL